MNDTRIQQIAEQHLNAWFSDDPQLSRKTLTEYVADAIKFAIYEHGCRTGTGPHDINNPPFQRHCGPQHDQE